VEDYPMSNVYNKKRVPYIEKNNGTIMLKEHYNYAKAIEYYNKALFAIKILVEDKNLNVGEEYVIKVIQEVEIPISSNLTLWYLKVADYDNVIKYANKLIEMNPEDAKQLYRRGMAYTQKMEFAKAKEDLVRANKLEPNDKGVNWWGCLDGLGVTY
jgi:tetratricopeptide (TPR) repeat protein